MIRNTLNTSATTNTIISFFVNILVIIYKTSPRTQETNPAHKPTNVRMFHIGLCPEPEIQPHNITINPTTNKHAITPAIPQNASPKQSSIIPAQIAEATPPPILTNEMTPHVGALNEPTIKQ